MAIKEQANCENLVWQEVIEPTNTETKEITKNYNFHYQLVRDCMQCKISLSRSL